MPETYVSRKIWLVGGATVVALASCAVLALTQHSPTARHLEAYSGPGAAGLPMKQHALASMDVSAEDPAPPPSPVTATPAAFRSMAKARIPSAVPSDRRASETDAPMIARTVTLIIMVKDLDASRTALDAMLNRTHGYAAQLAAGSPEDGARTLSASLRIPAPSLNAAMGELKRLGRTLNESQGGEEVTSQHEDLVARLRNSRETEERYRAILVQRTGKVSDVLEVEEKIASVRGDIERMEAEQQGLEHRVAFASVDVQFTEEYKAHLASSPTSVGTQLANALIAGLRHVGDSTLGLALFVEEYGPAVVFWALLLGVPAVIFWRRHRRAAAVTA